jgi:hypothetical protein
MRRPERAISLTLLCILCVNSACAGSAREAWTKLVGERAAQRPEFAYVENNPALPNVLIYGDSISVGYTQRVRENLKGKANVYRIYSNGWDTGRVIQHMKKMHDTMVEYWPFKWDVIHFNAGLHDLKYLDKNGKYDTKNGTQVRSPEDYGKKLKDIFAYFKEIAPDSKVIFATTTPVPEGSGGRKAGDAVRFNEAALEVLKDYPEIAINDLYTFTKANHAKWRASPGDVHYNATGKNAQGDEVAKVILTTLAKKRKSNQAIDNHKE